MKAPIWQQRIYGCKTDDGMSQCGSDIIVQYNWFPTSCLKHLLNVVERSYIKHDISVAI